MAELARNLPEPTAQVAPYVDALGLDLALDFLLAFGGSEIYLAVDPKSRSRVAAVVGKEKAAALAQVDHLLPRRVPLASQWIAAVLHVKGWSKQDIARRLRTTDVTVRGWLNDPTPGAKPRRKGDPDQLTLPFDQAG